jgi:hypothetical protein
MSKFLSQQDKPTPEQAMTMLENVVTGARQRLLPFMQDDYNRDYETPEDRQFAVSTMMKQAAETPDLFSATLGGYCGHAQHFADLGLKALGLKTHWYTLEKAPTGDNAKWFQENGVAPGSALLNDKAAHNHVALAVEIHTTEGKKHYLVEPTFRQFCTPDAQSPGRLLENSPDGEYMSGKLKTTGVLELTPQRATSYLAAFCNGQNPHTTPQESMDFLTTVPDRRQSNGSFPPANYLDSKSPAPTAPAFT